jgi:hypothetical protein
VHTHSLFADNAKLKQNKLWKLYMKSKRISENIYSAAADAEGAIVPTLEDLATSIIERSAALRADNTHNNKAAKKFALTELLKTLQSLGLSHYSSAVSQVIRS